MEHLLFGGDAAPVVASYAGGQSWDGGDFATYPKRQGWDDSLWQWNHDTDELPLQGRSYDEAAAFLQSWLFFGLLETVLGFKVDPEEFLCEVNKDGSLQKVITTTKLATHLETFNRDLKFWSAQERARREDIIWDALSEASVVNDSWNQVLYAGNLQTDSLLLHETLFCQTMLYLALARFLDKAIPSIGWMKLEGNKCSRFLEVRMDQAGWCPFDIQYLCVNLDPDVMAFIFSLGSHSTSTDHSVCHERYRGPRDHCVSQSIDAQSLPQHVTAECQCPHLGPNRELIEASIKNNNIPIIALVLQEDDPDDVGFMMWEEELDEDRPDMGRYFALSHVWKQGLGNPSTNLLPRCQLKRLARLLMNIRNDTDQGQTIEFSDPQHQEGQVTIPFWMDTFCIPVEPQLQELRNRCIARMRKIYECASGVIALDYDLQGMPKDANHAVCIGHLLSCSWRSRIWTYQEGNICCFLLIPTQTQVFDVSKIIDQYPELEPSYDPSDGTASGYIQTSITRTMVDVSRATVRTTVPPQFSSNPDEVLGAMLRAIAHRTTSRNGDEAICIATYMNIDPTPLLAKPAEERLPHLLRSLPVLSKAMLFAHGPRCHEKGLRWAPQTFLHPNGYNKAIRFPLLYRPDGPETKPTNIPPPVLCTNGLGMVAFFSGIRIQSESSRPLPAYFVIRLTTGKAFLVHMNEESNHPKPWNEVFAEPSTDYAILFANEQMLGEFSEGLVVEWLGEMEDGKLGCKWKYEVFVQDLEDFTNDDIRLKALRQASLQGYPIPLCKWVID